MRVTMGFARLLLAGLYLLVISFVVLAPSLVPGMMRA